MRIIKSTENISKVDIINAKGGSVPFKEWAKTGEWVDIGKAAVVEDGTSETGEVKEILYLFAENGDVYGGIGKTAADTVMQIIDVLTDGEKISVMAKLGKSKSEREFIILQVRSRA